MVTLPPLPASASRARRVVEERLAALGRPDLLDDVSVVVTELVTNAVMHARTPIELSVEASGAGVRVEVTDGSRTVPRWTPAAMSATSGRGLILVERTAREWGVEPHGSGKTVWALVDEPTGWVPESSFEELLALWSQDDEPQPAPAAGSDRVRVVLTVQVQQMLDSRAHTEDLVRELQLLVLDGDRTRAEAAVVRLAHRLAAANEDFSEGRRQMLAQTLSAAQRERSSVTLELSLRSDDAGAALRWLAALDEADSLAHRGALLLPPFPPDLVEFRRHYVAVIVRCLQEA